MQSGRVIRDGTDMAPETAYERAVSRSACGRVARSKYSRRRTAGLVVSEGQDGWVTDLATGEVAGRLRPAIVLSTDEDACTVFASGQTEVVAYARPFPARRTERVAPGHLVAVATAADGSDVVIWRWFDAIVLDSFDGAVRLWEPAHGSVLASPETGNTSTDRGVGLTYRPVCPAPSGGWPDPQSTAARMPTSNSTRSNASSSALAYGRASPDAALPRGSIALVRAACALRRNKRGLSGRRTQSALASPVRAASGTCPCRVP